MVTTRRQDTLVSVQELHAALGRPGLVVLDATVVLPRPEDDGPGRVTAAAGRSRFEAGHVPGARHADLVAAFSEPGAPFRFARPDAERLQRALADLGVAVDDEIVVYDSDRTLWAARLWWCIRAVGSHPVRVLDGGLRTWRAAGFPVATGPEPEAAGPPSSRQAPPPAERPDRAPVRAFVDRPAVEEVVAGRRPAQLVCALGLDVYTGAAPGRYTRTGHIPGSRPVPGADLLDAQARLLPDGRLRQHFADVLADPRPVVTYCGGGIWASLDALALHLLGRDDVSVYDGSLEEWSADPHLPMVTTP